jgi:hypothetical protein
LLKLVRAKLLAASPNECIPFEYIAHVLEEEQKIPRASLFRVLMIYNNDPTTLKLPGVTCASLETKQLMVHENIIYSSFDLVVNISESSTKLTGTVNYKPGCFETDIVDSLLGCVRSFINEIEAVVE